ncbi:hypothetical protein DPMN_117899 [Dreissena polymorpha]|uniref:Uncharacterized protein n=1 Tax=Dreissena polymorpha TaxID=45954 RepID=A0A9D4GGJ4_DREPO|nr:hypothetical protein DPMN_117899 [Dreissena polymorpha]
MLTTKTAVCQRFTQERVKLCTVTKRYPSTTTAAAVTSAVSTANGNSAITCIQSPVYTNEHTNT